MKKSLIFLLAMVFVLTGMLGILAACETPVASIRIENAPSTVTHWDTVDYSAINLVVTLEDGTEQTYKLTDRGVNFDEIDTNTLGFKTLTVRYSGLSTQVAIEVVEVEIDHTATFYYFKNTAGYEAYKEEVEKTTNDLTQFADQGVYYQVGTANGYRLLPVAEVIFDGHLLNPQNIDTTYKLYIWDGSKFDEVAKASESTYLEKVENNVYYFTKAAEHEIFQLEVTLDEGYQLATTFSDNTTITQKFEVVDGYNVYNALGLSVLDNLNVNSWADIKKAVLPWDDEKALSEFDNVSQVILHEELTITASDLPANYFWQKGDIALVDRNGDRRGISYEDALSRSFGSIKKYLEGSLKENYLGEDWEVSYNSNPGEDEEMFEPKTNNQRALYMSNGIGLSGNYLTLRYDSQFDETNPTGKGIYIVHDYKQTSDKGDNTSGYPEAHTSLIGYTNVLDEFQSKEEALANGAVQTRTVQNVYFAGDTQHTENTSGKPCGIMMMHTNMSDVVVKNTIGVRWFGNFEMEKYSAVVIDSCKFSNSFSQMVYAYSLSSIDVINSEMKEAGGPLFIVQDAPSSYDVNIEINIDQYSFDHMESWLSGAEMWFTINNVGGTIMTDLFDYATKTDELGATSNYRRYSDDNTNFKVNFILALIPNPGDLMSNQQPVKGAITIGDEGNKTTYASVFANLYALGDKGEALADKTLTALPNTSQTAELRAGVETMKTGIGALKQGTGDLRLTPMYQSGNTYAVLNPAVGIVPFNDTTAGIYSLIKSGGAVPGALNIAQGLKQLATALTGTLDKEDIDELNDLADEWEGFATTLNYVLEAPVDSEADWTSKNHLVAWINPMATQNDTSVRHFMLLIRRDTTAA